MYDYEFQYRPSREMTHVDALSRLPLHSNTNVDVDITSRLNQVNDSLMSLETVKREMKKDRVLSIVYNYVKKGWPNRKLNDEIKYYFRLKDKLSTEDDCLYFGNSLVIPEILKEHLLKQLHNSHEGVVRMKMLARGIVWWKNMGKDIENKVKLCQVCSVTQNVPREIVHTKWPSTKLPFQRVHLDLFHFQNQNYIILMDAYSKYINIQNLKTTNSESVIKYLTNLFLYFGLFSEIVTDNGPPFNSFTFVEFCKCNDIKVTKTPAYHPQSNGQAERGVQIVKRYFKKYVLDTKIKSCSIAYKVQKFLLDYNNTPSTVTGYSPNTLILSYVPKTKLNLINPKFRNNRPQVTFQLKKNKVLEYRSENKKLKFHKSYNYNYVNIYFKKGEKVLYRNHFKDFVKWIPAIVLKQISNIVYVIKIRNNVRTVHVNQLKRSNLENKWHSMYDWTNNNESNVKSPRPVRSRKPPDRYGYL